MTDAILRRVRPEQFREAILLLVTIGLLIFFATQIPDYFNARSVNRLTTGLAITLVVAVGQVLVVLTRNIDLSVSSMVGLTAYVVGTLLTRSETITPLLAVLLSMAIGLVLGSINGLIVAYGRAPAVIATLGTLALYRVVLVEFSGAKTVTTADLPDWLNDVPSATLLSAGGYDLRLMVGVALLVVFLGQLTLRYLPFGRRLRHWIQSGSGPHRWAPGAARRLHRVCDLRHAFRFGRVHVPCPLWTPHSHRRPGIGIAGGGGGSGRRRQHLWRLRFDDRRAARCRPDRNLAAEPIALGRGE